MKRVLKWLLVLLMGLLLAAVSYVGYVFFSYTRIPDGQPLDMVNEGMVAMRTGETYTVATSNVGYGANDADYSFFMDGGKYARALSKEAVQRNTAGIIGTLQAGNPDLLLLQEVDADADRSHHVDQRSLFAAGFPGFAQTYAVNYDSAYLPYPPLDPIGKSKSGIMTLSRFGMASAERRSLPISEGFSKLFDLDRCFSVQRIPVGDQTLVLVNAHLSAYASDQAVTWGQLDKMLGVLSEERQKGNYVICGGDFNCDLTGESMRKFGFEMSDVSWTQPFPADRLPEGFGIYADDNTPSCRNTNEPYRAGHTMVITVDGFIVSDNVDVQRVENMRSGFAHTDHEPVLMRFFMR